MSGAFPSSTSVLKPMTKYLQQARQLEKVAPQIAYYCRLYALQVGLKAQQKSKDDLAFLADQMKWLEAHAELKAPGGKEEAREKCEAFALQVFAHGDNEDRAGLATKKTALNFHAAYVLMDMCRQFASTPGANDLPSDLEEKQRYAIVKAADINKCIKLGVQPKAGPLTEPSQEEQDREDEALLATLGGPGGITATTASSSSSISPAAAGALPTTTESTSKAHHFGTAASPFPTGAIAGSLAASSTGYTPHAVGSASFHSAAAHHHTAMDGSPLPPTFTAATGDSSSSFPPSNPFYGDLSPTPLPDTAASYLPPATSASAPPATQPAHPSPPSFNPHAAHPTTGAPAAAAAASSWKSAGGVSAGHVSPFSKEGAAARNAAGNASSQAFSKRDTKKLDATRDAERIIKHALSAVVFSDIDTTVMKLKEALHILQPFSSK